MVSVDENDRVFLYFVILVFILIVIGVAIFVGVDFKSIEREISGGTACTTTADCGIGEYCSADDTCISTQSCDVDNDCPYGQTCSQFSSNTKRCVSITCKQNSDCPQGTGDSMPTIRCINKMCEAKACMNASTCSADEACIGGICTPIGKMCNGDSDCFRGTLKCVSNMCIQCSGGSDCPTGEYCDAGICKTNCSSNTECGSGMICSGGNCIPSSSPCGSSCSATSDCGGDCKHCVNGACTSIPGAEPMGDIRFECTSSDDCESGTCLPDNQNIMGVQTKTCGWKAVECLYSNGISGKMSTCPSTTAPWCVQGVCQASSAGTICGTTDGATQCDRKLSCINQICTSVRGVYGDKCTLNEVSDCEPGLTCSMSICAPTTSDLLL